MPRVTHVSMTTRLMVAIASQTSRSRSFGLRQAAAMQKRVAPAALACCAAATTFARSIKTFAQPY